MSPRGRDDAVSSCATRGSHADRTVSVAGCRIGTMPFVVWVKAVTGTVRNRGDLRWEEAFAATGAFNDTLHAEG